MASNRGDIDRRVVHAAEAALAKRKFVTAIDVLVGVGWLEPRRVDEWRQGRVEYLERVTVASLGKISTAMRSFRRWAQARGLKPSETAYLARTRDRRPLRFSKSGDPGIEQAYRTHWVSPELSEKKRARLAERESRPPELVVSGGGTAEAKLSHLDDLKRRMAQVGIDAQTFGAGEDTDPKIRAKARAKVLKQGLYPRDMTERMWHTPRERLYERALRGRWALFPVSPEPFYERLSNGLGEAFARRARRSSSRAGWRRRSSASTAPRRKARQRDSLPAVRWWRGATGRWSAAMTPTA